MSGVSPLRADLYTQHLVAIKARGGQRSPQLLA